MKKKIVRLETPQEESLFFALSCPNNLHKLAWLLNTELDLHLKESNGILHYNTIYPIVKDDESFANLTIVIVKNRIESNLLFKEVPNVDYIIKLMGNSLNIYSNELVSRFKSTPSIVAVIPVAIEKIKNLKLL